MVFFNQYFGINCQLSIQIISKITDLKKKLWEWFGFRGPPVKTSTYFAGFWRKTKSIQNIKYKLFELRFKTRQYKKTRNECRWNLSFNFVGSYIQIVYSNIYLLDWFCLINMCFQFLLSFRWKTGCDATCQPEQQQQCGHRQIKRKIHIHLRR